MLPMSISPKLMAVGALAAKAKTTCKSATIIGGRCSVLWPNPSQAQKAADYIPGCQSQQEAPSPEAFSPPRALLQHAIRLV
jgi:hypothetical protein